MSSKRPSLAESMKLAAKPEPEGAPAAAPVASKLAIPTEAPPEKPAQGFYAATRAGKKKVTATIAPSVHKQLKSLAVQRDTTTEALLAEAIDDLFRKHQVSID